MTLRDFFHFLENRSATFLARLANFPMSVGSPAIPDVDLPNQDPIFVADLVTKDVINVWDDKVTPPYVVQGSVVACVIQRRATVPPFCIDSKGKRITTPSYEDLLSFKKRKHMVLNEGPPSPKFVYDFVLTYDDACKSLFGSLASTENP
nr:hypothetical protein [Tanacetum cinerariifolium]